MLEDLKVPYDLDISLEDAAMLIRAERGRVIVPPLKLNPESLAVFSEMDGDKARF